MENKKSIMSLWESKSKKGKRYYTGYYKGKKVVAFINTNKKNPKEPDLRLYEKENTKEEVISLWCNASKNGVKFLSGKDGDDRIVGFFSKSKNENAPQIFGFISEPLEEKADSNFEKVDEEVPF